VAIGAELSLLTGLTLLQLVGCSPAAVTADQSADSQVAATAPVTVPPRFAPAAIEAMKKQLLDEPKIVDLVYDESAAIPWQIGVKPDGTRWTGYAGYICLTLSEKKLVDAKTDVRIVDIVALNRNGGNFREASLGHVRCSDGSDQGI